jgi:hypothetical protein
MHFKVVIAVLRRKRHQFRILIEKLKREGGHYLQATRRESLALAPKACLSVFAHVKISNSSFPV